MRSQTTTSCRIQVVSLMLAGLISMPAHAEVIPGRWEKVSTLEMTSPITVELKNGDQIDGDFESLSESEVELKIHAATARIPKADVRRITTQPKDSLGEGAIIGTFVGAGFMAALSTRPKYDLTARGALYFAAIGAAVGLGIGVVTDAAMKSEGIVVYKAPETPLSPERRDSKGRQR